jgi:hypothetical protein
MHRYGTMYGKTTRSERVHMVMNIQIFILDFKHAYAASRDVCGDDVLSQVHKTLTALVLYVVSVVSVSDFTCCLSLRVTYYFYSNK